MNIKELTEKYWPRGERIDLAKKRQAAYWRGETTDKPPVLINNENSPLLKDIPEIDYKEAWESPEKMFLHELRNIIASNHPDCDAVPSIRMNMGTAISLSMLGLEQDVFSDKMPWLAQHFKKDEAEKLTVADIKIQGSFAKGLDFMSAIKKETEGVVPMYSMDTQGPMDLAHLMVGDDIFMQFFDSPDYVNHLLSLSVNVIKKAVTAIKEINGESLGSMYYEHNLYAENIGTRVCEDTSCIIGGKDIKTFSVPHMRELAEYFNGIFVHYCGRNDDLTEAICSEPMMKAMNFGVVPGKVEEVAKERFESAMATCKKTGTIYTGGWPRYEDESAADYIDRMYLHAKAGYLIPNVYYALGDDGYSTPEEVLDIWYSKR